MNKVILGLIFVLFALAVLAFWPLAAVWSVNTLFGTDIPYTFRTWAAVVVLAALARLLTSSGKGE